MQQLRRPGVSRVCGEKVSAATTEKLGTHSHTHTHGHTSTHIYTLYPRYSPMVARVMTTKVLRSRSHIKCSETNNGPNLELNRHRLLKSQFDEYNNCFLLQI